MSEKTSNKKIASLFVDPQKGFTPLCPQELPVPDGHTIVDALMQIYDCTDVHICSSDAHSAKALFVVDAPEKAFQPLPHPNTDATFMLHCEVGTPGFELLDGLPSVLEYDYFVWKGVHPELHPYGACFHDLQNKLSTGVIEFLRCNEISTVIVGGLATDFCVAATVFQLLANGFSVGLYLPACRGVTEAGSQNQRLAMQQQGMVELLTIDALRQYADNARI